MTAIASTTVSGRCNGAITSARRWLIPIASIVLTTKTEDAEVGNPLHSTRHGRSPDRESYPCIQQALADFDGARILSQRQLNRGFFDGTRLISRLTLTLAA